MARKTSVISIAILGDNSKFKRAIQESQSKLDGFSRKVGTASVNVVRGFGVMSVAAGGLAAVVGKQLFDVGEELVALDQKIGTVFSGQSLDQVTGWADEVAARMGLTATQAAGLAANAGDLLKPMGFTADEAAGMSTEIIGLAGALSEWSGGQRSVEETAQILSKALLGERESLKELGISINQAQVDQRALTIAMQDGRDAITEQDKALATQQLILEKSTDAQEAFAAGGNNLTAAQNRLRAAFGELQEDMARKLMPVFSRAAEIVVELIDVFEEDGLGGVIANVSDRIKEAWPAIRTQLGKWAQGFLDWVKDVGPPFLAALGDWLVDVGKWFIDDALPVIVKKLEEWAGALLDWAVDVVPPLLDKLGDLIADVADWFSEDGLDMIVSKLGEWAAAFVDWIVPLLPGMVEKLTEVVLAIGEWIVTKGVPNLAANLVKWYDAFLDWTDGLAAELGPILVQELRDAGRVVAKEGGLELFLVGGLLGDEFITGLQERAHNFVKDAEKFGRQIVEGIKKGILAAPAALIDALASLLPGPLGGAVGSIGGLLEKIPGVTPFADGGIVTRPVLGLVGEAGPEAVIPLDRAGAMGGGEMNITVNMPAGADGDDVVRLLQDYVRRRGALPVAVGTARY